MHYFFLGIFYPFQYSQDHLETYFSLVRAGLGGNNNPNVQQFRSTYRKLLFSSPHISGEIKQNCYVEFPKNLLDISSEVMTISSSAWNRLLCARTIEINMEIDIFFNTEMEPYDKHIYALVASDVQEEIIRKIRNQTKASCQDCLNVFRENDKIYDSLIEKKIGRGQLNTQPCNDTFNIILASEKMSKVLQQNDQIDYACVAKTIFSNILLMESLYESSLFELHEKKGNSQLTHKESFVLGIVDTFLRMKSKQICGRISIEEQDEAKKQRKIRRDKILAGK